MDTIIHRWLRFPYALHVTIFSAPKRPKATVVLLHGIGNSAMAWEELIPLLPKNIKIIGIDLLGFGKSPKPRWAKYDARTQARSVGVTLFKLGLLQQPIIVGHSLGALVAVGVARRYSLLVKQLILCSPPFYKETNINARIPKRDEILKDLYRRAKKHPDRLEQFSPLMRKLGLTAKAFEVNSDNIGAYFAALESSIVNQTALNDATKLKLPVRILYGTLDPVIIGSHIRSLAKNQTNVTAKKIVTGHEVRGRYTKVLAKVIIDESLERRK